MLGSYIMISLILATAVIGLVGCCLVGATRQEQRGFLLLALVFGMITAAYVFVLMTIG